MPGHSWQLPIGPRCWGMVESTEQGMGRWKAQAWGAGRACALRRLGGCCSLMRSE